MAIGLGGDGHGRGRTTATPSPSESDAYPGEPAAFPLVTDATPSPGSSRPGRRLVAAVASLARPEQAGTIHIASTLPRGSGLSSSAAVAVALGEAFGVEGNALVVARLCQAAEHRIGVPVGIMDPLVCAGGRAGHALWIDTATDATPGGSGARRSRVLRGRHGPPA